MLGLSAARGPFIADAARAASGRADGGRLVQTTWGADAEFSRAHYLVRAEAIRSTWTIPLGAGRDLPLPAAALSVEGRYKLGPALWVAVRADRLTFGTVHGDLSSNE